MRTRADSQPRVLVVNGFPDGRTMYVIFLRHHGMAVRGVAKPQSALRILDRFRPEIIVTDLVFPTGRLDGAACIDAVRQRSDVPDPTIIVVSGLTQPRDEQRARKAGADVFVIKPCLPERLLVEVQHAFEARRWSAAGGPL